MNKKWDFDSWAKSYDKSVLDDDWFHDRVEELLDEYFQYVDQLSAAFIDAGFSVSSHHLSKYIWLLKAHHVSTTNG